MGKLVDDTVLDGALNILKNGVTQLCVCSTQPTNYTEATATYKLAIKTGLTSGSFTGPSNGDTNGRKIQVNAQSSLTVDTGGNAQHIALCSGSVLLYVTTCTPQALTGGNTVSVPAWDIEIADPTP
jgi:hypothetical protein